ncbi:MAG TPA: T9SS type A sorting domain-containing protein [Flavobacteriales bacterium]|nr:T9SS type A sorting domain-containing protein [Flavobacteriales bacterium]
MKKNYLLLAGFCMLIGAGANAQQMLNVPAMHNAAEHINHKPHLPQNRAVISDWYNSGNTMYNLGGTVAYYRNFLFPDSTVQVEFSTGMGYVWKHSLGHILDPTSTMFDAGGQTSVGTSNPYTVDSIAIPYRYWRPQTTNPDTLVIQIYSNPDITFVPNPGWSSGASYATVDYDTATRMGASPSQTITYLLTSADEISATQGLLQFPLGIAVPPGEKIGVTVTYFPGNPYSVGDTIDTYTSFAVTNQINAFVFYDYSDQDMVPEPTYYNNELNATTDVRYNISTNGWNGNYIPGTAWLGGFYHGDIYFKLTWDPAITTGITQQPAFTGLKVYPNPAANMINLRNATPLVKVNVLDVTGKTVLSMDGSNITTLDLSALTSGHYVLRLTAQDGSVANAQIVKE